MRSKQQRECMNIGNGELRRELIDETYLLLREYLEQMGAG